MLTFADVPPPPMLNPTTWYVVVGVVLLGLAALFIAKKLKK